MRRSAHAKAGKRKSFDANLLGRCGFFYGFCLAHKKGICLGCRCQADKRAAEGVLEWCSQLNCAERKGVTMCSECREIPCKEFDPKIGTFSGLYVSYIRDKIKPA
jgi:hypothetical protein